MKKRVHLWISGRVQGVFFRKTTQVVAKTLGICGWVRNLDDGRVEVVAEGEERDLKKLIEFCKRGPPLARVDGMDVKWEEYKGEFEKFEVRY